MGTLYGIPGCNPIPNLLRSTSSSAASLLHNICRLPTWCSLVAFCYSLQWFTMDRITVWIHQINSTVTVDTTGTMYESIYQLPWWGIMFCEFYALTKIPDDSAPCVPSSLRSLVSIMKCKGHLFSLNNLHIKCYIPTFPLNWLHTHTHIYIYNVEWWL